MTTILYISSDEHFNEGRNFVFSALCNKFNEETNHYKVLHGNFFDLTRYFDDVSPESISTFPNTVFVDFQDINDDAFTREVIDFLAEMSTTTIVSNCKEEHMDYALNKGILYVGADKPINESLSAISCSTCSPK